MGTYQPHPIDTSKIQLSSEMEQLTEVLAKNVHEVWASKRIEEGWVYGGTRDDVRKTHPCLVPYNQLPESEKEYDRATAVQTIKTILSSGYKILKA